MLIRLKKNNNTIVKRITFEISVWSNTSTKPSAFNMITQARRTVHVFTAVLQQACASCETGDPDFLANRPFLYIILCILPDSFFSHQFVPKFIY